MFASATLLVAIMSCSKSPQTSAPTREQRGEVVSLSGTVRAVEEAPRGRGKRFIGVQLEADDGKRWVLCYGHDEVLESFDGKRVAVEGRSYVPQHQALVAPHVEVTRVAADRADTSLSHVSAGELVALEGAFEERVMPEGTKLAGEHILYFVAHDGRRFLALTRRPWPALGAPTKAHVRTVEASPFTAHLGGPTVWVYRVEP